MVSTIRGLTRPIITMFLALAYTAFSAYQIYFTHVVSQEYAALTSGAILWWFYDRSKLKSQGAS